MNVTELMDFDRTYMAAVNFVMAGTEDYAACRCCLLNGLFAGFPVGAQAVEKYLKAFLLFVDPSIDVKNEYRHGIKKLALKASELKPEFNIIQFNHVIDRLEQHYQNRYPNHPKFNRATSTGELIGIDELVFHICDCFPIPEVPKFRNYGYFFIACCPWTPPIFPAKEWIELDNAPLARVRDSLVQRYKAMEKELGSD